MKFVVFFTMLMIGCASANRAKSQTFEMMDSLWRQHGTLNDIKRQLGEPDKLEKAKVMYLYSKSTVPRLYFELDEQLKIKIVFMFLESTQIERFKDFVHCEWQEKRSQQQIIDVITLVHEGQCKAQPIKFSYRSTMNSYEIWWGPAI